MALGPDQLNDLDQFIVEFLSEHEWASPNLLRLFYNDNREDRGEDGISGSYVSRRLGRLKEHGHVELVHSDGSTYRLVTNPYNGAGTDQETNGDAA